MAQISFQNVAGTSLYSPSSPSPGEAMLFLLAGSGTSAPPSVTLDATWGATSEGPLGYYLFLDSLPASGAYATFQEAALAALPPSPTHTSFAWMKWTGTKVSDVMVMSIQPGTDGPSTGSDLLIKPSPGIPALGIAASTPVATAVDATSSIQAFSPSYPPQPPQGGRPASRPSWAPGLLIPMTGDGVGCLQFQALMSEPPRPANPSSKQVFAVSIDPVRPFDDRRTYLKPTAIILDLGQQADGTFYLSPSRQAERGGPPRRQGIADWFARLWKR